MEFEDFANSIPDNENVTFQTPGIRAQYAGLDPAFRGIIERAPYKVPLNSAYRDPAHNAAVGGVPGSYHTQRKAIDIPLDVDPGLVSYLQNNGLTILDEPKKNHKHAQPGPNYAKAQAFNDFAASLPDEPVQPNPEQTLKAAVKSASPWMAGAPAPEHAIPLPAPQEPGLMSKLSSGWDQIMDNADKNSILNKGDGKLELYDPTSTAAMVMGNTGTYGQGIKGVAAMNTALNRAGISEYGDPGGLPGSVINAAPTFGEEYANNLQGIKDTLLAAEAENPNAKFFGSLLGAGAAPDFGVGKMIQGPGFLRHLAQGVYEGGRTGIASELGTNPDATGADIKRSAIEGGIGGGLIGAGGYGLNRYANKQVNHLLKTPEIEAANAGTAKYTPEELGELQDLNVADYINDNFGVTLSMKALGEKNAADRVKNLAERSRLLGQPGDVPLPKSMTADRIWEIGKKYEEAGLQDEADAYYSMAVDAIKKKSVSKPNAEMLKEYYGNVARDNSAFGNVKNSVVAEGAENFRRGFKTGILDASTVEDAGLIEAVNQRLLANKLIDKALKKPAIRQMHPPGRMGGSLLAGLLGGGVGLAAHGVAGGGIAAPLSMAAGYLVPTLTHTIPGGTAAMALGDLAPLIGGRLAGGLFPGSEPDPRLRLFAKPGARAVP